MHNMTRETLLLLEEIARKIKGSSVVPSNYRNSAQDIFLVLMSGHEFGFNTLQSLKAFHIIQGEVSIAVNAMMAVVQRSPHYLRHEVISTFPEEGSLQPSHGVEVRIWRKGNKSPFVGVYTMGEANQEGLLNKPNWRKMPRWMLRMRAASRAVKEGFSDVIHGLQDKEGMEDYSGRVEAPAQPQALPASGSNFAASIAAASPVASLPAPTKAEVVEVAELENKTSAESKTWPVKAMGKASGGSSGGSSDDEPRGLPDSLEVLDMRAKKLAVSLCRGIGRMGIKKLEQIGEHPKMIELKDMQIAEPECNAAVEIQNVREVYKMRMTELIAADHRRAHDAVQNVFFSKEEKKKEEGAGDDVLFVDGEPDDPDDDPEALEAFRRAMAKDGPLSPNVPVGDQEVDFNDVVHDPSM